jgi:hypothetical protein
MPHNLVPDGFEKVSGGHHAGSVFGFQGFSEEDHAESGDKVGGEDVFLHFGVDAEFFCQSMAS